MLTFFRRLQFINPKNGKNVTSSAKFIYGFQVKEKDHISTPSTSLTSKSSVPVNNSKRIEIICLQQKITELQHELRDSQQNIETLTKKMDKLKRDYRLPKHSPVSKTTQAPTNIKEQKHKLTNRILIFGSQQCVGLAAAMTDSTTNTRYEKYDIVADTKPNALSYKLPSC
ncbi:hypothetical protein HF086_001125 [Spodoptera exigua]|uniref:Uncharacterized protein n=1 Tax=Spodoptera exigua TaxID=7107 RepID=A0A922M3L7_SPOEX|nr:hypothetical protein HF086_001125 [Spodoptera exigua]